MTALVTALNEQVGVSVKRACAVLGASRSSVYRAQQPRREPKPRSTPANALTEAERQVVRSTLNSERFMDQAPRQVYATLLDEGHYLCHWRTMYRVLAAHDEVRERRDVRRHPVARRKPELCATGPNQVWTWDITYLRSWIPRVYYYLYSVLDLYSRYVVGWMIAERECSQLGRQVVAASATKQGIQPGQLTLHSDNGGPMRGKPLTQLLVDLGIVRSHSRPHTSNDNPFSEAHFRTLKYHPDFPDRFTDVDRSRSWASGFFNWYNHEHYHSGLNLLTPASVHYGEAGEVIRQRQLVLATAYAMQPARFSRGLPAIRELPAAVWINRPDDENLA